MAFGSFASSALLMVAILIFVISMLCYVFIFQNLPSPVELAEKKGFNEILSVLQSAQEVSQLSF